jgi:RHS repeat-associated protein
LTDPKVLDFAYDELSQLQSVDENGATAESYDYDESGNRTGRTYDPHNRLTNDGVFNYTYDDEGNLTSKTRLSDSQVTKFEWDFRNRLTSVTLLEADLTAKQIQYAYDMFDRRISENILLGTWDGISQVFVPAGPADGGFTGFVYSGDQLLFTRTADDGVGYISDVFLPGPLGDTLTQDHGASWATNDDAGNLSWLLTDRLGSVRYVLNSTDDSGGIDYDAFGNIESGSASPAELRSLFGFTGQVHDAATGLGFFHARYYDPFTGRFLSEDPIGFAGGDTNLYRYTGNNPVNRTDPMGLSWLSSALHWVQDVGAQIDDYVHDNGGWLAWGAGLAAAVLGPTVLPSIVEVGFLATSEGGVTVGGTIGLGIFSGALPASRGDKGGAGSGSLSAPSLLIGGGDAQPLPLQTPMIDSEVRLVHEVRTQKKDNEPDHRTAAEKILRLPLPQVERPIRDPRDPRPLGPPLDRQRIIVDPTNRNRIFYYERPLGPARLPLDVDVFPQIFGYDPGAEPKARIVITEEIMRKVFQENRERQSELDDRVRRDFQEILQRIHKDNERDRRPNILPIR